jgi:hypothetical protein
MPKAQLIEIQRITLSCQRHSFPNWGIFDPEGVVFDEGLVFRPAARLAKGSAPNFERWHF